MLACYKRLPFRVCTRTLPNKTYNFPPLIRAYPHKQTNLELSQFETSKSVKKLYGDNLSALGTIYSGTSPLGHPLSKGQLHSGDTKFGCEKMFT